eukprot:2431116-Alexandrium_andersonii.AAC.1
MAASHRHNWLSVSGTQSVVRYSQGSMPGDPWGDLVFELLQARVCRKLREELEQEGLLPCVSCQGDEVFPDMAAPRLD